MKTVLILLLILLALLLALGFFLASFFMKIRRQSLEEARAWQEAQYDISWYDSLEKEDYTVASYDGYALHAELLKNPSPSRRYVLLSHGYTDNLCFVNKKSPKSEGKFPSFVLGIPQFRKVA